MTHHQFPVKIQLKVQLGVTSGRPKSILTTGHSDDSMTQRLKVVKSVRFQKAIEPLLKTSMRRDTRRDTTDLNSKSIAACCDILRHKVARPSTMRVSRQCFTMFHTSVTQVTVADHRKSRASLTRPWASGAASMSCLAGRSQIKHAVYSSKQHQLEW